MSTKPPLDTIWHIPDDLWSLIAPIFGPEKPLGSPGRPHTPYRLAFDAIVYILRTGCQWQALPHQEYGAGSTIDGIYRKWVKAALFAEAWKLLLEY